MSKQTNTSDLDNIVDELFALWRELGAQNLGSTDFHDGIGYAIECAIIRFIGNEAYLARMEANASNRKSSE